jgi:hypothetical protein
MQTMQKDTQETKNKWAHNELGSLAKISLGGTIKDITLSFY